MSYERREDNKTIWFFFLNLDIVFCNSTPGKFANIRDIEWDGIRVKEFEAAQIHFLSDVFVFAAVIKAKTPLNQV